MHRPATARRRQISPNELCIDCIFGLLLPPVKSTKVRGNHILWDKALGTSGFFVFRECQNSDQPCPDRCCKGDRFQGTISVNLVLISVKLRKEVPKSVTGSERRGLSVFQIIGRQFSKSVFKVAREGADVGVTYLNGYLGHGVIISTFEQKAGFVESKFLQVF